MKISNKNTKNLTGAAIWVDTETGLYKLADCEALIEVSEKIQTLKLLGSETEYAVKSYSAVLVICGNVKSGICGNIDVNLLKSVRKFSLKFEPLETRFKQCSILVNEFDNIIPVEIAFNGEWRFDITANLEIVKGLFPDLIFSGN